MKPLSPANPIGLAFVFSLSAKGIQPGAIPIHSKLELNLTAYKGDLAISYVLPKTSTPSDRHSFTSINSPFSSWSQSQVKSDVFNRECGFNTYQSKYSSNGELSYKSYAYPLLEYSKNNVSLNHIWHNSESGSNMKLELKTI